ncbi:MAG TPA: hypothetical protein VF657_23630 [Actinoplanes sp.]
MEIGNLVKRAISVSEKAPPLLNVDRIATILLVTDRPESMQFPAMPASELPPLMRSR